MLSKFATVVATVIVGSMLLSSPADAQFWKRNKNKDKGERSEKQKSGDTACEDISLQFSPDDDEFADLDAVRLTGVTSLPVEIGPFRDKRRIDDPREIGRNIEDADDDDEEDRKTLYVTTDDDIADFVREHVGVILSEIGYDVVGPGEGKVVISGDVRSFHVEEDNTYSADVRLLLKAATSGGTVLYEAMHGESATNWGRSYKCENYFETLAEALIETVHDMADEDEFYEAMRRAAR